MKEIVCPLCGSARQRHWLNNRDRLHQIDAVEFALVRCTACGLVFLNPQPTPEEVARYYPKEYGPYRDHEEIFRYGYVTRLAQKFFGRDRRAILLRETEKDTSVRTYLDFGCGGGSHLVRMKQVHPLWRLYGLDNNVTACANTTAKGFEVFCGDASAIDLPKDFFDTVYMAHVIEHVHDPRRTIGIVHALLKSGGTIEISTPNVASFGARLFRSRWFALETPRHLCLFDPNTITRLLVESGFRVDRIIFERGPKVELKSLAYVLGRRDLRINPVLWHLVRPITALLSRYGKTSIMTVYATRL